MGRGLLRAFFGQRRATAAIEFALTVPVMLALMSGIVEFGRVFEVYSSVNRLATRYAIAWADCSDYPSGTCSTEMALYASSFAIQNFASQLTSTTTLRMFEVQMSSSGTTASIVYVYPVGATLTAAEMSTAQNAIAASQTGVVVTVSYTHTLVFFQTLMAPFLGNSRVITSTVAQLKS